MHFIAHIWPIFHTAYIPSDSLNGVDFNILVKLHAPATPKNVQYFLMPNHCVETLILTLESVWLTRRNNWLDWGPLNNLWTRVKEGKEVIGAFPRQKCQISNMCPLYWNWQRTAHIINTFTKEMKQWVWTVGRFVLLVAVVNRQPT